MSLGRGDPEREGHFHRHTGTNEWHLLGAERAADLGGEGRRLLLPIMITTSRVLLLSGREAGQAIT